MIKLTLLHPVQAIPIQTWTFSSKDVISIGRAPDNHVVLYSAVVSRRHAELRRHGDTWELTNLGTNGTYLDGKRVQQSLVTSGSVLRLARSGPNLKIQFAADQAEEVESVSSAEADLPPLESDYALPDFNTQYHDDPDRGTEISALTAKPPTPSCGHPRRSQTSLFCPDCGQPIQVQQVIRGYQVVKVLGQGGMGTTYLTWMDGQIRVLKEVNADLADNPKAQELFEREARTLQQLSHTGIPKFFDFFVSSGKRYLAMEMIYGQDLEQWVLQRGPVTAAQATDWMVQTCQVLDYLHTLPSPIIHRDIKPSNLLARVVSHQIVVLDFGAVRSAEQSYGTRIGAEGYSAPEQGRGWPVPQSDLYAIGPTLLFLLTGQSPARFYRHAERGLRLQLDGRPETEHIASDLKQVITTVTDPAPEKRYATAQELTTALLNCAKAPSLQD